MTAEESIGLFNNTGILMFDSTEVPKIIKEEALKDAMKILLPILIELGGRTLTKQWIKNAVDTVGSDDFTTLGITEYNELKRSAWFTKVHEQVLIQHAYHAKQRNKIEKIKGEFKIKHDKYVAKMVAYKLAHGDKSDYIQLQWTVSKQSQQLLDEIQKDWLKVQSFMGIPKDQP
jgi:hypothetical protein